MKRKFAYPAIGLALGTFILTLSVVTPNSKATGGTLQPHEGVGAVHTHEVYQMNKSSIIQDEWVSVGGSDYIPTTVKTAEGFLVLDRIAQ